MLGRSLFAFRRNRPHAGTRALPLLPSLDPFLGFLLHSCFLIISQQHPILSCIHPEGTKKSGSSCVCFLPTCGSLEPIDSPVLYRFNVKSFPAVFAKLIEYWDSTTCLNWLSKTLRSTERDLLVLPSSVVREALRLEESVFPFGHSHHLIFSIHL